LLVVIVFWWLVFPIFFFFFFLLTIQRQYISTWTADNTSYYIGLGLNTEKLGSLSSPPFQLCMRRWGPSIELSKP